MVSGERTYDIRRRVNTRLQAHLTRAESLTADLAHTTPGSLSAQWVLNETSSSALSVAKGVFRAATSDNVQPLALLTVEAFGNTLAICQQTQLVVEKEASKRHVAYVVKFLQSQIGCAANDSATHLASSGAGVRFLGLAAALLCTSSTFTAAQALESMIKATSRSDQILPTLGQLQDLLAALDYKLARTGFADNVLGWEAVLVGYPDLPEAISQALRFDHQSPTAEGLRAVGDTTSTTIVRITAAVTCPWVIAFTKWCLGDPPKIIIEDSTVIVDQPNSRVTLIVKERDTTAITVEVFDELDNLSQLWSESDPVYMTRSQWTGMVSIQSFGQKRLRSLQLGTGLGNRALLQALCYSFGYIKSSFTLRSEYYRPVVGPVDNPDLAPNLWPSDTKILEILKEYMGSLEYSAPEISALRKDEKIVDLPTIRAHLDELQAQCFCTNCRPDATLDKQPLLMLGGAPGVLEYEGSRYDRVFWNTNYSSIGVEPSEWTDVEVCGPQNLIPEGRLQWLVKKGDKCLKVSCGPTSSARAFIPMKMIDVAAQSLYVRACRHKKNAVLNPPDHKAVFITPHYLHNSSAVDHFQPPLSKTCVVAVSGNEGLRLFALSG
ncbi:MAG: hypothetical protein M1835_000923, partial [Candelina submexicana]